MTTTLGDVASIDVHCSDTGMHRSSDVTFSDTRSSFTRRKLDELGASDGSCDKAHTFEVVYDG